MASTADSVEESKFNPNSNPIYFNPPVPFFILCLDCALGKNAYQSKYLDRAIEYGETGLQCYKFY